VEAKGRRKDTWQQRFEKVLKSANERMERDAEYMARGLNLDRLLKRTVDYYQINAGDLKTKSKVLMISTTRAVLGCLAVRRLNISCVDLARKLKLHLQRSVRQL